MNLFQRSPSSRLRPEEPAQPRRDMVFVFGSNTSGIHGAGAAAVALRQHGATWGVGEGHVGNSYALPTKEVKVAPRKAGDSGLVTMPYLQIAEHVDAFIRYAREHPELKFQITQIGCGLAGLRPEHMAPLFTKAPENCYFDLKWRPHLPARKGDDYRYWGTF